MFFHGTQLRSTPTLAPGGIDIQIAHQVDDIGEEAWNRLSAGRPFASARWYRFGEKVLINDRPHYLIVSRHGEPVGRATFWLASQVPLPIASRTTRTLMGVLFRRWPVLVCRSPVVDRDGLILPPDPELGRVVLAAIADAAEALARRNSASFILFNYLNDEEANRRAWPGNLIAVNAGSAGTQLKIVWPDFQSYLKGLRRSTRHSYRVNCNHARRLGIAVTVHTNVPVLEDVLALVRNVERHHNAPVTPWARQIMENLTMVDGRWLAAEVQGRITACCVLVSDRETGVLTLLGRDYAAQYAYFQLMYAAVAYAIENGLRAIRCGTGAYELKRRLGYETDNYTYTVFSSRSRVLRWLGNKLAGYEGSASTV